jgi:hypothetical protein
MTPNKKTIASPDIVIEVVGRVLGGDERVGEGGGRGKEE